MTGTVRITVRPAEPADAEVWVATYLDALAAAYAELMPAEFVQQQWDRSADLVLDRRALFSRTVDDPPGPRAWVAENATGMVAVAEAGPGPGDWEVARGFPAPSTTRQLRRLYAIPRAHGSGAGQALLDAAIGENPAYLWIMAGNARAEAFYRRNRFVPDGLTGMGGPSWFGRPMFRMHRS